MLTGDAESPQFTKTDNAAHVMLGADLGASIYKTTAQAAESWRRNTNAEGMKCAEIAARQGART